MSIAIQRINRAIADMPTGGMQTGKLHIKLEYSDAQRAIAEIEGLMVERDALAAQVEVLKALVKEDAHQAYWEASDENRSDRWADNFDDDVRKKFDDYWENNGHQSEQLPSPAACLAQVKAETLDAAIAYATTRLNPNLSVFNKDRLLEYADRIRQEVE